MRYLTRPFSVLIAAFRQDWRWTAAILAWMWLGLVAGFASLYLMTQEQVGHALLLWLILVAVFVKVLTLDPRKRS